MDISSNPHKMNLMKKCLQELAPTCCLEIENDEMKRLVSFVESGDKMMIEATYDEMHEIQQQIFIKLIKTLHFTDSIETVKKNMLKFLKSDENIKS